MKKIIALLLLTLIFACEKDKPEPIQNRLTEREVFKALIGTWKPNRLGYDVNFNKTLSVKESDPWFSYRLTFNKDSTIVSLKDSTIISKGKFEVEMTEKLDAIKYIIVSPHMQIWLSLVYEENIIKLDHFTDSTLIFLGVGSDGDMFSEFKRVK